MESESVCVCVLCVCIFTVRALDSGWVHSEEVGRKLGSCVDRSISNGNFAESAMFFC